MTCKCASHTAVADLGLLEEGFRFWQITLIARITLCLARVAKALALVMQNLCKGCEAVDYLCKAQKICGTYDL